MNSRCAGEGPGGASRRGEPGPTLGKKARGKQGSSLRDTLPGSNLQRHRLSGSPAAAAASSSSPSSSPAAASGPVTRSAGKRKPGA